MNELKQLVGNYMIIFLTAIAVMYYIYWIVTRMKNKTQKRNSRQVICEKQKNTLKVDLDVFIKENYKPTFIGEEKNIKADLIYVLNH